MVDSSDNIMESNSRCLTLGSGLHLTLSQSDHTGTLLDRTGLVSTVFTTADSQLSTTKSSASVELGCIGQLAVFSDACMMSDVLTAVGNGGPVLLADSKVRHDHKAVITYDSAVKQQVVTVSYTHLTLPTIYSV